MLFNGDNARLNQEPSNSFVGQEVGQVRSTRTPAIRMDTPHIMLPNKHGFQHEEAFGIHAKITGKLGMVLIMNV